MTVMRPEEIALALLRRWWIVALAALVAGLVAYVGTASQDKTYTASARVMSVGKAKAMIEGHDRREDEASDEPPDRRNRQRSIAYSR